ncbi:hypothetical protein [Chryseosolibacter indicus]|uniref:Uncharacterized protein n=1 Tax=Chryseosolibacter indicus TaxID=2782351 RepID=A0ABS5VUV4_9BACT|nr:hypothetical protein [Chryseosolibacter indicus]MBT1704602.1 hypothetical protein [Chryseosolibacter indicus]
MTEEKIPGIHNYCDRWCERCVFANRCAIYEKESDARQEQLNIKNKAFWERLSQNFSKAKSLLEDAAKRQGLDLNLLQQEIELNQKKEEEIRVASEEHPLNKLGIEYEDFTEHWLKTQPGMLEKLNTLKEELTLGTQSHDVAKAQTVIIKESLAVIQWYSTLIPSKIIRALTGKLHDDLWEEDYNQRDYLGSAKIVLLSIERSMHAWLSLFELLPTQEDEFLTALSLLERMKKATLQEFPKAMAFIRPGFDEYIV